MTAGAGPGPPSKVGKRLELTGLRQGRPAGLGAGEAPTELSSWGLEQVT